jgi:antitoxin CptB
MRIPLYFYGLLHEMTDPLAARRRRLAYRAWHRGTREADFMIGSFCDRYASTWSEIEIEWFEALLNEIDVDIMAWAMRTAEAPAKYRGPLLDAFCRLDFMVPHK